MNKYNLALTLPAMTVSSSKSKQVIVPNTAVGFTKLSVNFACCRSQKLILDMVSKTVAKKETPEYYENLNANPSIIDIS